MFKEQLAVYKGDMKHFWENNKKSKIVWGIVILIIISIVVVFGKEKTNEDPSLATVVQGDVVDAVVLSGRTSSASEVQLGFADQGRIARVLVTEGQKVSKGQLLASIDTSDLYLNSISKITKEQDALVGNAYRNLVSSDLQLVPNNSSLASITPTISGLYTGPEGQYRIRIYESSGVTRRSFEVSGLESGITQELVLNSSVPLGTRGLYIQFSGIPDTGEWVLNIPNTRSVGYAALFNAYESAKASRDRIIADAQASNDAVLSRMNKRKIFAPFSGTVAQVGIKEGESTGSITTSESAGGTITLISENDYEVVLKAPEISVAKLAVGQEVSLSLDAYGKDVLFPGRIISINPAETIVEGVPVYETKVSFTNKDDRIRSGMTATATIIINEKKDVVTVPARYIRTDNNDTYVFVLVGEKTEKRSVVTGLRGSDSLVEIVSGLSAGEQVRTDAL